MAMLAEPRRKQKIVNLRGGNKAWSEDSNKFGQRMLERMGWKSGKGLGAREDGVVSHVAARYKNDEKGLGYEESAEQWTQHEDSFERLLANLAAGKNENVPEPTGESLEAKSKRSRARVHYHKFTRGKDLSRYSEKDLANIFGKKTLKDTTVAAELEIEQDSVKPTKEAEVENEPGAGQYFTTGGSMLDYFNSKLKLLGKQNLPLRSREPSLDQDFSFKGFNTSDNDKPERFSEDEHQTETKELKLKKKKKKRKEQIECDTNNPIVDLDLKHRDKPEGLSGDEHRMETMELKLKKKKRKRKEQIECNINNPIVDSDLNQEEHLTIPVKKKKHRERDEPISEVCAPTDSNPDTVTRKKKKEEK